MPARRVVIDPKAVAPPKRLDVCPGCGASLAWITKQDLRFVGVVPSRCLPGREPRAYEVRCRDCKRVLTVVVTHDGGMTASVGVAAFAVERDRDAVADAFVRSDGRDRTR
jgi:hypothetical protein